jgi:hypothetical protein
MRVRLGHDVGYRLLDFATCQSLCPQESSGMLTAMDGIGLLVGNLNAELFLDRHNHLHGVQAVQSKVVLEVCCSADLWSLVRLL